MLSSDPLTTAEIRKSIINDVLTRHEITMEQLISRSHKPDLVAARKDAAQLLFAAGFSQARIARILHKDDTTVAAYFNRRRRSKMRQRRRGTFLIETLSADVGKIVVECSTKAGLRSIGHGDELDLGAGVCRGE